ncbi:MAG: RnfABCDGE type electron transport complex subunit D [Nitrospirae bacterium]|nr:RnfABCDGE type electron transport complex subunit D [Nitrospirota bacterium]
MGKLEELRLVVSSSPHAQSEETIEKIMYYVILALLPAAGVGIYFFGFNAIRVIVLSVVTAIISEALMQKAMGRRIAVKDGSAVLTGLLLAMNLPSNAPWWLVIIGSAFAIVIGKQVFGGLGFNIFNPALVARVFLIISWPVQMTTWPKPLPLFSKALVDAVTGATPLGLLKAELLLKDNIGEVANISMIDLIIGNVGGSLGEVSAIALLLGGIFLIYRNYISWHIPASFIGTVIIISGIFWIIDPTRYAGPLFHTVSGGLMLGAFFMATDYVTSPITPKGMLIFGFGCGLITILIRLFGTYPEGVSFAILLMNMVTPLIDKYIKPTLFGEVKEGA